MSASGLLRKDFPSQSAPRAATRAWLDDDNLALSAAIIDTLTDGDPADTCVVAVGSRAGRSLSAWLESQQVTCPVLMPRDFISGRAWDFAVVVGAAEWF